MIVNAKFIGTSDEYYKNGSGYKLFAEIKGIQLANSGQSERMLFIHQFKNRKTIVLYQSFKSFLKNWEIL